MNVFTIHHCGLCHNPDTDPPPQTLFVVIDSSGTAGTGSQYLFYKGIFCVISSQTIRKNLHCTVHKCAFSYNLVWNWISTWQYWLNCLFSVWQLHNLQYYPYNIYTNTVQATPLITQWRSLNVIKGEFDIIVWKNDIGLNNNKIKKKLQISFLLIN